jgi:hypothetical protein
MLRDVNVQDAPSIMTDDEEAVELQTIQRRVRGPVTGNGTATFQDEESGVGQ